MKVVSMVDEALLHSISLLFDESLQIGFQILMLGIVEVQASIGILEWYNRMIFTSSKAINLIRMIGQDDTFW